MIARRRFLQTASAAIASAMDTMNAQQVPNSEGSEPPKLKAPAGTCDCHHHIYDAARFPPPSSLRMISHATFEDFLLLKKRVGFTRDIVVTPAAYVNDNRVTLDAIRRLGPHARGVAVIRDTITDAELKALADGGIRGIRFSLADPANKATSIEMIEPLSKRVHALGWHIQINMNPGQIVANEALWNRVPAQIVFDHMGHVPPAAGVNSPVFAVIRRLVDKRRAWVKLSVANDNTIDGPPGYADITKVARAYVKAAPERMVWGSNWPHPNETKNPDDAMLFDLMERWAPDEKTRTRILVHNPETLYGFPRQS